MINSMLLGEPIGQSWLQLSELALAFVLSALIGLEREIRQKSAGLRTYTLVGVSSALIMLVSKYGFTDIIENGRVVLDSFTRRGPDCHGNRVHRRRRIFFIRKTSFGGSRHVDRLAYGRSGHGRRSRPTDPSHRRNLRPFHRGVRLPGDRARVCPSRTRRGHRFTVYALRGAARRVENYPCGLHQPKIYLAACQIEGKPGLRGKIQSGAQAGKGRGTGWEDHPEDADEAQFGNLPSEGIVSLLVEVRGARPVGRPTAHFNEIAGVTAVRVGDRNYASVSYSQRKRTLPASADPRTAADVQAKFLCENQNSCAASLRSRKSNHIHANRASTSRNKKNGAYCHHHIFFLKKCVFLSASSSDI